MFLSCCSPSSAKTTSNLLRHPPGLWPTRRCPRLGKTLQACCDIYAIAEDVSAIDDNIADIDAHAELDTPVRRHLGVALRHRALDLDGATHRIHHAREFHQHSSPVVFTMRPRCSLILGSIKSRRCVLSRASVPSSSVPIRRLYPATSAARMAESRRSTRSVAKVHLRHTARQFTPSVAAAKRPGWDLPSPPVLALRVG